MSDRTCLMVVNDVAHAVHSACLIDLPDIEYDGRGPGSNRPLMKKRRPTPFDLRGCEVFQQMWGSTALGFGGIGGAAMTSANVVVIRGLRGEAAVYFGSRLAYVIVQPNEVFLGDVTRRCMADVRGAKAKYEKETPVKKEI